MYNNLVDKVRRVRSSFAVLFIAALCLASAGCSREADKASASDVMPLAARVDRLDGEVGIDRQTDPQDSSQDQSKTDWAKATVNTPVSVGARVYVKDKSHAAIAFSGRNYARLNPRTSLDVLSLSQRRTQLALRDGSGIFDVGALAPGELFEVATPNGAVDFQQPGLYQVGIDDRGSTLVSVLSGIAQVIGLAGSGQVGRGQLLTFGGNDGSEAYVSQLDSGVCGNITNDYYAYRYPTTYDGRYADYQRYQDDPYYYDPYRRSSSYQYIPDDAEVSGLDDLDDYGDWQDVPGHGHSWCPRVSSNWAPYRDGSWYNDQPLGLTWVSNERWGWAPYHYGRWVNVNQRWYWVPGEIVSRPLYSPALVAFVAFDQDDRVGWVPLGPGDPYVPRYYDRNYQPQYIGSTTYITQNVNVTNIVNYNVPGAVTVVRSREFTQVVTPGTALTADSALLGRSRPVLDPYAVPRLKEIAPEIRSHGPRVQMTNTADQALSRSVVTSQDPIAPAVVANTARALKVKSVPEAEGKRKLQINNSGQTVTAIQPNGLPVPAVQKGQNQTPTAQERDARVAALAAQAAQGDKSAKREMRQLQDQQRVQENVDRHAAQQETATQQQAQKQQQKAERKAAQQTATQQTATQQQEQKQQQKAERKAAQQQPAVQQQQQKQEQKATRKAARQEPPVQQQEPKQQQKAERKAAQRQQPPVQQQQEKQQQKAERKAAQQQQPPVQQQQQQQKQQQKSERKAAAQQQPPPVQQQQQQQKQQQKSERKAAAQQQQPPVQQQQQQQKQQQKSERKDAQQQQQQQQQPPAQTSPPKADRKGEKAKNKNANNNGSPNQ